MLSFDVFYYKSKTKLTSAQHPARVHSSAPQHPRRGEEPCPAAAYFPAARARPLPAPLLRSPSWARRESCRHQPPAGRGRRIRDVAGMLSARKIPGRVLWAARCAVHFPGAHPSLCPRNGPRGSRRRPGAQAVPALPGSFCARAARRSWDAVISIHGRCIFFNATSLFRLVADSRIRFPMLFAFPVLWRIKIFVFLQSVLGRQN